MEDTYNKIVLRNVLFRGGWNASERNGSTQSDAHCSNAEELNARQQMRLHVMGDQKRRMQCEFDYYLSLRLAGSLGGAKELACAPGLAYSSAPPSESHMDHWSIRGICGHHVAACVDIKKPISKHWRWTSLNLHRRPSIFFLIKVSETLCSNCIE